MRVGRESRKHSSCRLTVRHTNRLSRRQVACTISNRFSTPCEPSVAKPTSAPTTPTSKRSVDLPVPPAFAWQYYVDARERQRWVCVKFSKDPYCVTPNAQGRLGPGATQHCNHAPGTWLREYIDWRPFDYFTCRTAAPALGRFIGPRPEIETVEFVANGDPGTRIVACSRLTGRSRFSLLTYKAQRRLTETFWRRSTTALLRC